MLPLYERDYKPRGEGRPTPAIAFALSATLLGSWFWIPILCTYIPVCPSCALSDSSLLSPGQHEDPGKDHDNE